MTPEAEGVLMPDQPSRAVQDYLKAIHSLGGAEQMVSPVAIASQLEVRAPSVTGMLKRLAEAGWIVYEPGRGARLTEAGIAEARRVIRRHRLVELFLTRVLGLDWSEVDAEAEALEHAISPRLEQALASYLGEPLEDLFEIEVGSQVIPLGSEGLAGLRGELHEENSPQRHRGHREERTEKED
jgi:Mn-dependent DtxR family transcriptional regulator